MHVYVTSNIIINVNNSLSWLFAYYTHALPPSYLKSICSITFILTGPVSEQAQTQIQTLIPKVEPKPDGPHGKK